MDIYGTKLLPLSKNFSQPYQANEDVVTNVEVWPRYTVASLSITNRALFCNHKPMDREEWIMYHDNSNRSTLCAREATSQVVEEVQTEHEGIICNLENDTFDVPKHIIYSVTHILDMSLKFLANTPGTCYECPSDPNRNIHLPHIAMDANQEDICPMRDKSCVPNRSHILNTSYATHKYKLVQMYHTCHSEPFTTVSNLVPRFQQSSPT